MGRANMNDLKIFARIVALIALMFWCVASVDAQQKTPAPASKTPIVHKQVPHRVSHLAHRATAARGARKDTVRSVPAKQAQTHPVVAKKPEAVKPAAVPAALSPIALADQTPALPQTGHGRDPFEALIRPSDPNAAHANLPPGIAGLQVATLRLQGMVKTPDGMVAVVANPQDSVYFLHDGDHVYDGVVEKIGIEDVTFRQQSKDAFGRTIDRDVSKRLYPIAGDEQ